MTDVKSDLMKVTCGVPQGSVLGPKLFVLYINDICKVSEVLKMVLFADDTNLYCSGKSLEQLLNTVELELRVFRKWFDVNRLSLNLSKTKFIIFSNRQSNNKVKLTINNEEIERVYGNTFWGVIIDHKLCWKSHINHVKTKMSKSIAILNITKHILNEKTLYILYCAQKKAVKIVKRVDYYEPTNNLFINLHALTFLDLAGLYSLQLMYKMYNNLLPNCIQRLFKIRESQYNLRGLYMFKKVRARTNAKSRCLSVKGVDLWNKGDKELKVFHFANLRKCIKFR